MSINSYLQLGSVEALIVRKPIKNLHLSVLPPNGWVRVTAPQQMSDDSIRTMLSLRLPWIKKQQTRFNGQQRQLKREYISGESHYLFGRRYRLEVILKDDLPRVSVKGKNKILLQVRPKSSTAKKQEVLADWYREELRVVVDEMIVRWQKKIGVEVRTWNIKQMKTRWGTCNPAKAHILINLELAKKPISCIEYVVVHELIHLIEAKHNERFIALMTKYVPKWKSLKDELNRFILSYNEWAVGKTF